MEMHTRMAPEANEIAAEGRKETCPELRSASGTNERKIQTRTTGGLDMLLKGWEILQ